MIKPLYFLLGVGFGCLIVYYLMSQGSHNQDGMIAVPIIGAVILLLWSAIEELENL